MPPRRKKQERSENSVEQALSTALKLFSSQGFGATSMRQIAEESGLSMGNLYHHFPNKKAIFQQLLDRYSARLLAPEHPLQQIFSRGDFPDDLEALAEVIEKVVAANAPESVLIYIDVVEFQGECIHGFYQGLAARLRESYGPKLAARQAAGQFADDVDPMVGVIVAIRWFFYFFTVEKCFGAAMHMGLTRQQATGELIRLLRRGLLPRV
ncbi:MAG: TetR/AcrR family transcriptional regulator [Acidobacteriota bacterium]